MARYTEGRSSFRRKGTAADQRRWPGKEKTMLKILKSLMAELLPGWAKARALKYRKSTVGKRGGSLSTGNPVPDTHGRVTRSPAR